MGVDPSVEVDFFERDRRWHRRSRSRMSISSASWTSIDLDAGGRPRT